MQSERRLGELARQHGLADHQVAQLGALLTHLEHDEHAPTSVRTRHEAIDVHLADSLSGLAVEELRHAGRIADLGAGAGFPGLVLAVALPQARVVLVESQRRKCEYVAAAAEASGIPNVDVVCSRAEEWAGGAGGNDAVTARALASLNVLAEYAAPLLRPGGVLVAWKGRRDPLEEADARAAAAELGLEQRQIANVKPYPGVQARHLYVYSKVGETPPKYPRRPGMAAKRPLTANP